VPADARCLTLWVHENRAARVGRVIPLRIVVVPAPGRDRSPDPIFFLAGGPGQAATGLVAYPGIPKAMRSRRDLVFVDQRGTGGSNALTCPFYGPPQDVQSYFGPFLPVEKVRECRDRLARTADLSQYTTSSSVEDLEEVRVALGYQQVNLIGGSYGTRLAMEYVRRYGQHVRTVRLDGVVPTSIRMPEGFGITAQRALDDLLDECSGDPACSAAFPSIESEARAVFARLSESPVQATVRSERGGAAQVTVTAAHVAEAIRYMLYSSQQAARVPLVLHEAYRGDYGAIAQYLLRWRSDGTFDGLYLSVTCAEDVPFVASDAEAAESATFMRGYRVREQRAACELWPRGTAPGGIAEPVKSNVPALLVSGALDPVTTPEHGQAVAQWLPNSLHVIVPSGGHSLNGLTGLDCLDGIATRFIEQGSVRGLDTSCVSRIRRSGFAVVP
jgi:pimeloyl-ACP methyl ester carboxylesterase